MMTKTFWITLAGAGLCGTALFVSRTVMRQRLAEQVGAETAAVEALEKERRNLRTAHGDAPLRRALPAEPETKTEATRRSEERVGQARAKLETLVEALREVGGKSVEFFRMLPDILPAVRNLSAEELFAVAESMSVPDGGAAGMLRMILFALVAEQNPRLVIRNSEAMGDSQTRKAVLGALIRREPDEALRWMAHADLDDREKREIAGLMVCGLLRRDVGKALAFIREGRVEFGDEFASWNAVALPKETIPGLVAAMRDPANADMREMLLAMVVKSSLLEGGVVAVRRRMEELALDKKEFGDYLNGNVENLMASQPEVFLDWMLEDRFLETNRGPILGAFVSWADRDFNAAGEWLGRQQASPAKDAAIQRFVRKVVAVDPQAAVEWAASIDGEGARAVSLVFAAEQWLAKDKPTAEKWLAENGINLEALRDRAGGAANPAVGPQSTFEAPVRVETE